MGRKKEPPRVAVRLTESEKKKIATAAAKCGLVPGVKRYTMFGLPVTVLSGIMPVISKKQYSQG
ncbi:MAG: hypothetical protein IKO51_08155 [Clostridia bacterium]|nr:hypothetical protein [Clostridia bacterium]